MDQLSFGYVWYRLGDAFKFFRFPNWEYHALTKFHYTGGDFSPQQCVKERSDFWGNGSSMIANRGGLGLWTPYPGDLDSVSLPKLALEDQKKADFLIPYPEDLDSVVLPKAVEVEIF
ncbi:unnamed protein product [Dovyalis caffra]|uniref:Uncharacterized protein n=1 Tax=Dovyalis caffra TaxID=77055 RepID=A0AAV1RR45_9ROSI|nr:unnamed protein product [Dovyalis caffra]